jgi:hypothetical protein
MLIKVLHCGDYLVKTVSIVLVYYGFAMPVFAADFKNQGVGHGSLYLELGGRAAPNAVGCEMGVSEYADDYTTFYFAGSIIAAEHLDDFFTGLSVGFRINARSRISPFVGLGAFAGYSESTVGAANDGIDNDGDSYVDEYGEEKTYVDNALATIYPEVGINIFLTELMSVIFATKYHFTTEGKAFDFRMFNFGIAVVL